MTAGGALAYGLACACRLMTAARDPWWVIGSAAVALHLGRAIPVADIDVLGSARDCTAALAAAGVAPGVAAPDDRFRSVVFGRVATPGLPVEFMGALTVRTADGWHAVAPGPAAYIRVGDIRVPVPSRDALAAMLRGFDRPKDHARLALLVRG